MPAPHPHIELEHAVPGIAEGARFHRWVTVLVGLTAVAAGVLAYGEAEASRQKEQGFVRAARYAEQIVVELTASTQPEQFTEDAGRTVSAAAIQARARVVAAEPGQPTAYAEALAQAERRAGSRLVPIAKRMGSVPARTPGLDEDTGAAVRANEPEVDALLKTQQAAATNADTWAGRQESTIAALGLVAIAAALGGLAGLMGTGRPGRLAAATGSAALFAAVVWAGLTFAL